MGYPKQLQTSHQPASRARNPPFLPSVGRNRGSRAFPGERGRRSPSSTFKKPAQRVAIQLRERRIPSRAAFPRAQPAIPAIGWQKSRVARVSPGGADGAERQAFAKRQFRGLSYSFICEDSSRRRIIRARNPPFLPWAGRNRGLCAFPPGRGRRRPASTCKTPVQRVVIQLYKRRPLSCALLPRAQLAIPAIGWQKSRVVRFIDKEQVASSL